MASIPVPHDYDLVAIATAAGVPDPDKRRYIAGVLHVDGVSQAALDGALAAYDHTLLLRARLRTRIEAERDRRRWQAVTAHGRSWQADPASQDLLNKAIALHTAGLPLPEVWRDAANDNMPVTALADLLAIAGAMASQTQDAYQWSWAKKAEVTAAGTAPALAAIALTVAPPQD